jgi:hypothetical protein
MLKSLRLLGMGVALAALVAVASTWNASGPLKAQPFVPAGGPFPTFQAGTPITAASGTVANASAAATLAAAAGRTTYICGFIVTSTGSTAATVVAPTITGTITGTLTFAYASVAGATLNNPALIAPLNGCIAASAPNTAIVVTVPALGAGNTNSTVNAWGYQL